MSAPQPAPDESAPTSTRQRVGGLSALLALMVLILTGVVAVVLAVEFRRHSGSSFTFDGRPIEHPDRVLAAAEATVQAAIADKPNVHTADTHCFFAVPHQVGGGRRLPNVDRTAYCAPVLLVDSLTGQPFIRVGLHGQTHGKGERVTVDGLPSSLATVAFPAGTDLIRPDGRQLAASITDLKPPIPPPAPANVFVTADALGTSSAALADLPTQMGGFEGGLSLTHAGQVQRYGSGAAARSAPVGQRLLAFAVNISYSGSGAKPPTLDWGVAVDGGALRPAPRPTASGLYRVIAVPTTAHTVDLVLRSREITQTLSLLTGRPGLQNLAVLARKNWLDPVRKVGDVTLLYAGADSPQPSRAHITVSGAFLEYWAGGAATDKHPQRRDHAYLDVGITYTQTINGRTRGPFAFPPGLLTLTRHGGLAAHPIDLAAGIPALRSKIYNVFDVPAQFTTGAITIGGTMHIDDQHTVSVAEPFKFEVEFRSG
jgi:hypothetical protein